MMIKLGISPKNNEENLFKLISLALLTIRSNPQPWQTVGQNQTTKLYNPNSRFAEKWSR